MSGHIKIDRRILAWEWYREKHTFKLFIHLILRANWRDGRFQGVEIPRGSLASSYQNLAGETGLSIQNVRTAVKNLKKTGELTVIRHTKFSVFTVKNYDKYQTPNTESNMDSTGDQQASNIQLTTIEEKKEGKKERREREGQFAPPTLEDVNRYCRENGLVVDAERFFDHYSSRNWMSGRNRISDWKGSCATGTGRTGKRTGNCGLRGSVILSSVNMTCMSWSGSCCRVRKRCCRSLLPISFPSHRRRRKEGADMAAEIRGVLKYPGSKWKIARRLVELIPEHRSYLEPYAGSLAVLFCKRPSAIETVNDLDSDVTNLFWCIQKDSQRLARLVMTTPYAREVYDQQFEGADQLRYASRFQRAAGFLVRCWQGYGYRTDGYKPGWKNDIQGRERAYALWDWYHLPGWIVEVVERLRVVQIENRPASEVIRRFWSDNIFMYLDPPYVLGTRKGRRKQYRYEMSDADHEELLKLILKSPAKIMISGYESEMYNDYLRGWEKRQFQSCAEGGSVRTETVWMNYRQDYQMNIFDYENGLHGTDNRNYANNKTEGLSEQ